MPRHPTSSSSLPDPQMSESAKAGGGSKATFDKEEGTLHICLASESKCVESVCSDE